MSSQGLLDGAASELFNTYETDYQVAHNEAEQKLSQISDLDGEPRREAMKAVEKSTDECIEILDQLAIEVQNVQSGARSAYNAKIRSYRSDVDKLKKGLKKLQDDEDRRQLLGSNNYSKDQQRSQLLQSNAALERTSERLRESSRIAAETEQIGSNIMLDLRGQREQLQNSRQTLFEADGYVDRSIQTLKSMTRRAAANKIISYAIIAVLILLILLVIASKFW
ncbi:t-SNARE VTI1 AltName: Full=Qb-SNARE VTI1; AltName: Full=Vesicle transport v-SNARE protein VTI1; AltName: Full=VPS10-interacting protein 1 [Cyberlindnera jadinii]|uniref:V-snare-domain-containing protein n=1 Tax=Cyberlindnera jadinii (strain ATCC 18201 / CBS 1600 / BCRC 20928 / JCM 3617 / NBRC 0987 / NRRL Y-1542) TaxID=983966 RepID=A0A0H5CBY4_CYBJN|nr:V-snare-domain-containing protein [Cyberlindnera jadinii NRRL Y-1542]ODV72856.1 V-snare-domain-containing protein [Cyberlindnera jadinii NRRL Y-1542]CEP22124.1 t-SNARE VTI1 AltName: Full=Qb-SNARE VTI1; AltName: Full=Vesicle transport v-SNARE protein VTI1; AltName: Full=VPS10-interacting protein 1 [Cyberlindnera jadinii]